MSESAFTYSYYIDTINYFEYKYLGAIFLLTIEDERDGKGEYTGRRGKMPKRKTHFKPDVLFRVRKACAETGCVNRGRTLSYEKGCVQEHYVVYLIVEEDKMDLQGCYYSYECIVTCVKDLL